MTESPEAIGAPIVPPPLPQSVGVTPFDTTTNVVFFHIPKTAGTAVTRYFVGHYGIGRSFLWSYEQATAFDASSVEGRYFTAHINYTEYQRIRAPHKSVVFLRDPKARLLSTYYFLRSYTLGENDTAPRAMVLAKEYGLADWLRYVNEHPDEPDLRQLDNFYARILIGRPFSDSKEKVALSETDKNYFLARERLRHFDAIGLVEQFNASMMMIAKVTGLPAPTDEVLRPTNTFAEATAGTTVVREPRTDEIEALLEPLTDVDDKLFRYASALWREQCLAYD